MTILGLAVFGVASAAASFLITLFGTRYLITYLKKKNMTVSDYHKSGKPPIPRPGGPAIIAGIGIGEFALFLVTGSYSVLGVLLVTLISGLVGIIDDLKTLGGVVKPALLLVGGLPLLALQYLILSSKVFDPHLSLPLFSTPAHIPPLSRIGNNVFIGPSAVLTNDPYPLSDKMIGVTVEDGAIICARAVIKAGVKVGKNSVVGMGSVVTKDVPPETVVVGTPAKPVYSRAEYETKRLAWNKRP